MATYAIGDVQGCFDDLCVLLDKISFDEKHDILWFAGDMVNRGPKSLATLRFIKQLGPRHKVVLGNHDLHLLAVASGARELQSTDTFSDILQAADRDECIEWLRGQPLLHFDQSKNALMLHAGLVPQWSVAQALNLAREVEVLLRGSQYRDFLTHMYGESPTQWHDHLEGWERARTITNILTRLRFCSAEGELDLLSHGAPGTQPEPFKAWFDVYTNNDGVDILFGHWAALEGRCRAAHCYALDTGCVWGGSLRALRLEDKQIFET